MKPVKEIEREGEASAHAMSASHSWDASSKVSSCDDYAGTANPLINELKKYIAAMQVCGLVCQGMIPHTQLLE